MFNVECVVAINTYKGCSNIVADITNSKKRPHLRQSVLRQCTTVVCRQLVAIVMDELYFEAH
jgi:hypothetical protein